MVPRYWLLSVLALCIILGDLALGQELAKGWAWSGIAAATLENQSGPAPAPGPAPSGTCETCSGTGKVGDGRVFQICRDCNGTGKVVAQAAQQCDGGPCPPVPAPSLPSPKAVLQSSKPEVICEGGYCYPVTQAQQRYQTRPPARVIMRKGFFFRR